MPAVTFRADRAWGVIEGAYTGAICAQKDSLHRRQMLGRLLGA